MTIEAIQRLKTPATPEGCRSFAVVVHFPSPFCPDLTRKGRVFQWVTEQLKAFDEIKRWLQKPPVLYMPCNKGRFHPYSDISKLATGSTI